MIKKQIKYNKGFTLVETMFAVIILTFTIVTMMTVVANSLFASRYARNEITANYLLQEVIDSLRNRRDTAVFLQNTTTVDDAWSTVLSNNYYTRCSDPDRGCYFDVLSGSTTPTLCPTNAVGQPSNCPDLYYNANATTTPFYTYTNGFGYVNSGFKRKIVIIQNPSNTDEINVTVTVFWKNGSVNKSRSLTTSLTKWQ